MPGARVRGLAVDGRGRAIAVWESSRDGKSVVTVAEETSTGAWTTRDPGAALGGRDSAPSVAAGADGAAIVAWVHATDPSGVFVSEREASGEWRDPRSPFAANAVEPCVASSASSEQLIAWCQQSAGTWGVAIADRMPGQAWRRPAGADGVVSPSILFANQPRLALDARGDALVAWYQSEGVPLMTYVSERRGAEGSFSHPSTPEHLSAGGAPVTSDPFANPRPALGPHGEAAVVWVQDDGEGGTRVYLATRAALGAWTHPADLRDSFSLGSRVARGAQVAFGAAGELYVVWSERLGAEETVVAARRAPDGRWTDAGRAPAKLSRGRLAYAPCIVAGPLGGVLATWVEEDGAATRRIVARRTGSDRPWELPEQLSRETPADPGVPLATVGPGDRAVVAWTAGAADRVVFARIE